MNAIPFSSPHERAHLLAAAGLLHDVGKALQPTGLTVPVEIERLTPMICPTDPRTQASTHRHVVYTALALDEAKSSNFGSLDCAALFRIAVYHHRPGNTFDEHLLTKADWIASGHDRRQTAQDAEQIAGLHPVITGLSWPRADELRSAHFPTRALSFDERAFLPIAEQDFRAFAEGCVSLRDRLLKGLRRDYANPTACIDGLLGLTERLLHAVPASRHRGQQPDISLYDHSRVVAAFAACLAVQHPDGPLDALKIRGSYRLVGVALGSIQKFILRNITPPDAPAAQSGEKGLARRLRARSFYVSLLSWLTARRLLDAVGMPAVNLLIDAGGRSLLLLPDTSQILGQLRQAMGWVRTWFSYRLGGAIRLDIALSEPLDDAAFTREQFSTTYRRLDEALAASRLEFPRPDLKNENGWAESGWAARDVALPTDTKQFQDDLAALGRALPKAKFLALDSQDGALWSADDIMGYRVSLHDRPPQTGRCVALRVHENGLDTTPLYITANYVPRATHADVCRLRAAAPADDRLEDLDEASQIGDILTFTELARLATDEAGNAIGHDMLAALKADVDNLGTLLAYGLGNHVSFGRLAGMARGLDLFFKGFLPQQLQQRYPHIYTVFAGGDDLFLIGPWYDLVLLVHDLRGWFQRFTCGNPNLTFSAGLIFAGATTPVGHLASAADEALDRAKEQGRNRLAFGSVTLAWEQFDQALKLHRLFLRPGCRQHLRSSMLNRFLQYARMALPETRQGRNASPADLKWRAQLNYDLRRNLADPCSHADLQELHSFLMEKIRTAEDARILYVGAALTLYHARGASHVVPAAQ